jgi:hypothetical protein
VGEGFQTSLFSGAGETDILGENFRWEIANETEKLTLNAINE